MALTSLLRGLGILLMFAGLRMLFGPIELLTSRILLVGTLFSFGASFIAAAISIPLSLIAISLGWLLYRPLIGILLLFLAGSIIFGAMMLLFAASKLRSKPA